MKKAFTTAELLISLIVIGAIATLVVPTIVKDYNTRIRSAAIKDTYTTIMSAIERACADKNVSVFAHTGYMYDVQNFMETYFKGKKGNFNGFRHCAKVSLSAVSACDNWIGATNYKNSYDYKLQGGTFLKIQCYNVVSNKERVCKFYIDTNGYGAPNVGSVDAFSFHIGSDSNNIINAEPDRVCKNDPSGENCIQELIKNDWQIDKL